MKVLISKTKGIVTSEEFKVIELFIEFLQSHLKLYNDIKLSLVEKRSGLMTTGVRNPNGEILVLCHKRLLIDILRTISHEWVHEYQYQKLGASNKKTIKDIGGPEENQANAISGILIKKFQKQHPEIEEIIYSEN
jgi:hypothetical protein